VGKRNKRDLWLAKIIKQAGPKNSASRRGRALRGEIVRKLPEIWKGGVQLDLVESPVSNVKDKQLSFKTKNDLLRVVKGSVRVGGRNGDLSSERLQQSRLKAP